MAFWDFLRSKPEVRRLDGLSVPTWSEVSQGEVSLIGTAGEGRALSLVPVFASCRILAGTVSTLPLKTYRDIDGEKVKAPQAKLFADLEKSARLVPWLHECMTSLLLRGNAYGEIIDRDGYGYPTQIIWRNPVDVVWDSGKRPGDPFGWRIGGRLVPETQVVHIPWFTLPGAREGLSPIGAFAATVTGGLEAARYASDWFAAGGFPPGTFQNVDQTVTQDVANIVKARVGAAIKSKQPLVYGKDWEYKPITVPPGEAQFVEAQRLTATQIAAVYGLPPEKVAGQSANSLTYATLESNQLDFVTNGLRPWLVKLEHAFSAILPDRQYVRFNADALVRTDIKTRHEVYEISQRIGLRNRDDNRALEDLPSLPNGEGQTYAPAPRLPAPAPPAPDEAPDNVRSIGWARPA